MDLVTRIKNSARTFVNNTVIADPREGHILAQGLVNAVRNDNHENDEAVDLWCNFADERISEIKAVIDLADRDREGTKPEFLEN